MHTQIICISISLSLSIYIYIFIRMCYPRTKNLAFHGFDSNIYFEFAAITHVLFN